MKVNYKGIQIRQNPLTGDYFLFLNEEKPS